MKRILLSNKVNIGALSDFIDLLYKLQKEFQMQTIEINSINTDSRNMYAELEGPSGLIKLIYEYYNNEFYISTNSNDKDIEEIKKIKSTIKEFIENV